MKVSWYTTEIGRIHATVKDEDLLTFLESLTKLGFEAEVTIED